MKIKYQGKTGKRSIRTCEHCSNKFETLDIKVRSKRERFCSSLCYKNYRKEHKQDEKLLNVFHQKKHKYGLSSRDYLNLYVIQDNKCAICGIAEKEIESKRKKLCVDHNHIDNRVRGLLCNACNQGLGNFKDNIEYLQNAIKYLGSSSKDEDATLIQSS